MKLSMPGVCSDAGTNRAEIKITASAMLIKINGKAKLSGVALDWLRSNSRDIASGETDMQHLLSASY
jgi:hypothetical protein